MAKPDTLFGISFPEWNLMTHTFPGIISVVVSWGLLLNSDWADQAWNELIKTWYLWIGVAMLGFVIGETIDCWSWKVSDFFGRLDKPCANSCPWERKWAFCVTVCRDDPEAGSMNKAQIETRFLINTGILLFFVFVASLVRWCLLLPSTTLAYQKCGAYLYWAFIFALPALAFGLLWSAKQRYGRRSKAANALIAFRSNEFTSFCKDMSQETKKRLPCKNESCPNV
jgi:hypothetical protein